MNLPLSRAAIAAVLIGVTLSACHFGNDTNAPSNGVAANGQPARDPAELPAVTVGPTQDPSLPDASEALAALDAAEKAKELAVASPPVLGTDKGAEKPADTASAPALPAQATDQTGPPAQTKVN